MFRNNDLPGVMLASAAQRLHAPLCGRADAARRVLAANIKAIARRSIMLAAGIDVSRCCSICVKNRARSRDAIARWLRAQGVRDR